MNETYDSVWEALIDSPQEAENLRMRSRLMMEISKQVLNWEVAQKEAAQRLNITQPRLNDLLKGKIDKFSVDALLNMLAGAGLEMEMQIRATPVLATPSTGESWREWS
ncbi:XRE family transcriptional regulator [Pseudomonas silvicola]|nr:XRE family transcriptional regulator [Pseudomonas silvicola]